MSLRQEVFVVEQNCPYLDADNKDQCSYHLMIHEDNALVAYARILPKGESYDAYCSIGRIATAPSHRKKGIGRKLTRYAIDQCNLVFPHDEIKISAQSYLLDFYKEFKFEEVGEEYLEDDIPHKAMIIKHNK